MSLGSPLEVLITVSPDASLALLLTGIILSRRYADRIIIPLLDRIGGRLADPLLEEREREQLRTQRLRNELLEVEVERRKAALDVRRGPQEIPAQVVEGLIDRGVNALAERGGEDSVVTIIRRIGASDVVPEEVEINFPVLMGMDVDILQTEHLPEIEEPSVGETDDA